MTTPIEQLAGRCRNFMLELYPQVADPHWRQAMRLAIFSLVQVACSPALKMPTPEILQLHAAGPRCSPHDHLSSSTDFAIKKTATVRSKATLR